MDIVKNGESSTSPRPQGGEAGRSPVFNGEEVKKTRLVMPRFDGTYTEASYPAEKLTTASLSSETTPRFARYDIPTQPRRIVRCTCQALRCQ